MVGLAFDLSRCGSTRVLAGSRAAIYTPGKLFICCSACPPCPLSRGRPPLASSPWRSSSSPSPPVYLLFTIDRPLPYTTTEPAVRDPRAGLLRRGAWHGILEADRALARVSAGLAVMGPSLLWLFAGRSAPSSRGASRADSQFCPPSSRRSSYGLDPRPGCRVCLAICVPLRLCRAGHRAR